MLKVESPNSPLIHKIRLPLPVYQATSCNSCTLFSEGREGEACELSN
jgi:hypothetical protein